MKKKYIICFLFLLAASGRKFYYWYRMNNKKKKYTIGIMQCASNKPLDTLVQSYKENMKQLSDKEVEFIHKNNQGSYIEASAIGQQMHLDSDIDLIFALGCSAALGITTYEGKKPIVIGGISDPTVFGFEKKNNVYGIVDIFDYQKVFNYILNKYNPMIISVMHSSGKSAEKEIKPFIELCHSHNILCHEFIVNCENDIISLLDSAIAESQILIIPCDTMIVSTFPYIVKKCQEVNLPLLTCFLDGVDMGATDALGVDYIQYGANLARLSSRLLDKILVEEQFTVSEYISKK